MNIVRGSQKLPLIITTKVLVLLASATRLDLFEEVVALVIYQDESREVNYLTLPNCFHTQFRIFHTLDALDIVL